MQTMVYVPVGVTMIDKSNQELSLKLDRLRGAIRKRVCRYTIEDMLIFLEEHVEVHFCKEERLMARFGCPEYAAHKVKHEHFAMELGFLREEMQNIRALGLNGSYELSVETVQIVTDWIHDHAMIYDKALGEFLRARSYSDSEGAPVLCGGEEHLPEGVLTFCSVCHKIRGCKGLWKKKEDYESIPSVVVYSHGLCPDCLLLYYADYYQEKS